VPLERFTDATNPFGGITMLKVEVKRDAVIVNMNGSEYHLPNARCWK
jgi:hypothetical protein